MNDNRLLLNFVSLIIQKITCCDYCRSTTLLFCQSELCAQYTKMIEFVQLIIYSMNEVLCVVGVPIFSF